MGNYAAVDCGTLSTRLLISNPQGEPIVRLTRVTGLGEGVDRSGAMRAEAAERALSVLRDYRRLMDSHCVSATRMVGTSALRDAANRESFSSVAEEVIGAPLSLLSGEEEAALSFLGATAELRSTSGPWLVSDIGGGSTELVIGPEPAGARSLNLGCVRVTERFFHSDPPTAGQSAAARCVATRPIERRPSRKYRHFTRPAGSWGWPGRSPPWPATTRASSCTTTMQYTTTSCRGRRWRGRWWSWLPGRHVSGLVCPGSSRPGRRLSSAALWSWTR